MLTFQMMFFDSPQTSPSPMCLWCQAKKKKIDPKATMVSPWWRPQIGVPWNFYGSSFSLWICGWKCKGYAIWRVPRLLKRGTFIHSITPSGDVTTQNFGVDDGCSGWSWMSDDVVGGGYGGRLWCWGIWQRRGVMVQFSRGGRKRIKQGKEG